jgi:hypothetical protein
MKNLPVIWLLAVVSYPGSAKRDALKKVRSNLFG